MTLIVEDGTGLTNADSYASLEAANARADALGNAAWPDLDEEVQEQRLRKATIYITQAYRTRWGGTRLLRTQALDWPRYGVEADGWCVESTIVPTEVVNACIDLAFDANIDTLNPNQTRALIRKKVGPIEKEWSPNASQATKYRAIDMTLAPYLMGSGVNVRLVRA